MKAVGIEEEEARDASSEYPAIGVMMEVAGS